jgi:cytochrome c oxidase subunit 2
VRGKSASSEFAASTATSAPALAEGVSIVPFQSAFHQLFTQDATIAAVVFGLVILLLLTSLLLSWRRRRRGRDPSRRAEANKLETGYVAVLLGIAIFLMISSVYANARDFPDPPKPALRVQVIAYQWCWRFHYEGQPVTVDGQCRGGPLPVLVLPVGRPVELDVTSVDVIHAFWVPYLRAKMYAYPGHTNSLTVTLSRPGRWIGRCAQLCGLYHYQMDFYLQAVSPSAFGQFLRARGGTPAGVTR